jgi:hypothetical protein
MYFQFSENAQYPYFTRTENNNGILGYVNYLDKKHLVKGNSLAIGMISMLFHYMSHDFYAGQFTKTAFPKFDGFNENVALYFISLLRKFQKLYQGVLVRDFEQTFYDTIVSLPTLDGEISFPYMESVIRELQDERLSKLNDYLKESGLENTELSQEEKDAILRLRHDRVEWGKFRYDEIFNHIMQGRRLKKEDQKPGNIPFVMSGITNTGVVNYISNPVAYFPANSITIDIFGNTFYRDFDYGLGDDTGAYWNDEMQYTKSQMLFLASSMEKSIEGKFSYGNKLRSSQSLGFYMYLPITSDDEIDWDFMHNLISAESRIAIRGVVEWKASIESEMKSHLLLNKKKKG